MTRQIPLSTGLLGKSRVRECSFRPEARMNLSILSFFVVKGELTYLRDPGGRVLKASAWGAYCMESGRASLFI